MQKNSLQTKEKRMEKKSECINKNIVKTSLGKKKTKNQKTKKKKTNTGKSRIDKFSFLAPTLRFTPISFALPLPLFHSLSIPSFPSVYSVPAPLENVAETS